MISSIVWLILIQLGFIDTEHTPWYIYLPVCLIEIVVYVVSLPKICDWLEGEGK